MRNVSTYLLLALSLALLANCSASSSDAGSVQLAVSVPQALSASGVTRVKVTVSATDMSSLAVDLAPSNGSWGGLLGNIPAGSNRSFLAEAFDSSGSKRFQGSTSGVTVTANQTLAVALTLQELAPAPPYSNEAPLIDSLVASSTSVQTGGSLSLTATAHDPNTGDTLTLAWTASGGTFSAPAAASTSWTAPASTGVQTLTFTVTDSQGAAVSISLTVNVTSGASTGSAALNVSFNLWPTVSKVSASLNRLDAGQSTSVSANASDADGDALSYLWTASCPGTWTNANSSTASFVPSSIPASACNNCRLTVTVQDGRGGQTTGSLNLCVATSSSERFPPTFTNSYQSAASASLGQTVSFDVTAMDSQASFLTFTWTANTGLLGTAQHTATTSHTVWTAPSCAVTGVPTSVTAAVTNAYGLSASKAFSISGLPACTSNEWAAAGTLSAGRNLHTATLLSSGQVLVTGGSGTSGDLASAEVYNPATHSWSSAGSMASARELHTETLLPSGKVLVTGGSNGSTWLSSAEVYDPASHSWSSAGAMASVRFRHTATLLPSGKVLVAGGYNGSFLTTAELYDPATHSWSSAGSMASRRIDHTATLLPTGKVLVAGGGIASGVETAAAELYDPATHSWSSAGSMSVSRALHSATLLPSGKVLVAGAFRGRSSAELYDPATNAWSPAGSMALGRYSHTATLLSSGKVLVTGGAGAAATAEVYDPAANSWSAVASMATARQAHTAIRLSSGKVLVSGGYNGGSLASVELFTP